MKRTEKESNILSFCDIKNVFLSSRKKMWKAACVGGISFFLYFGLNEPLYRAEASFQEASERIGEDSAFKSFLGMISSAPEAPQTTSLMKSFRVLKPLCHQYGVQIQEQKRCGLLMRGFLSYLESFKAARRLPLKRDDSFVFRDVEFEGREPFPFELSFLEADRFEVYDEKKTKLSEGKLDQPCTIQDLKFCLHKVPDTLKLRKKYRFTVQDWVSSVQSLRSKIHIRRDPDNGSILILEVEDRDPFFAQDFVNDLMSQYQAYLKSEHDHIAKSQLAYLEKKQSHILESMRSLFDEHIAYLKENLGESGFLGVEEESQYFLSSHHHIQSKLLAIDVECRRLQALEKEDRIGCVAEEGGFSQRVNLLSQRIQDFKQQRDLIELALASSLSPASQGNQEEIQRIREMRSSLQELLKQQDQSGEIAKNFEGPLGVLLETLYQRGEKETFCDYLQNYTRLLSMKEKMLQERIFYGKNPPEELEGMDLNSVKMLFTQYNTKLDQSEANIHQYERLQREIENPLFDVSSLGAVLRDSFSQKVIEEITALRLRMRDEKYYSSKEAKRWEEDIELQLGALKEHLDQLSMMEQINIDLVKDKISGLQKVNLDCINQQISVLYEQIHDEIKERKKALFLEKQVLQNKLEELKNSLSKNIPEKWRFEKWLSMKTEMVNKVMQTVTEVVESKSLANHLHHVQSKPLDQATLPSSPKPHHLFLFTFLGAFAFALGTFSFAFISSFLRGFPANYEKLKYLGFPLLGKVSPFCDGEDLKNPIAEDLELIRSLSLFAQGSQVISLFAGMGPDYSYAFCENLVRQGVHPILIRCDFQSKKKSEEMPGLFEFYEKEVDRFFIRKKEGYDYISSGGYTPFGTEIIQSASFQKVLQFAKQNYDQVILLFKGPLCSVESKVALTFSDKAAVSVVEEQIEKLTPFIDWGYDEDCCRISFITLT